MLSFLRCRRFWRNGAFALVAPTLCFCLALPVVAVLAYGNPQWCRWIYIVQSYYLGRPACMPPKNKNYTGEWLTWNPSGKITSKYNYVNGLPHGFCYEEYDDGIRDEYRFDHSLYLYQIRYRNGKLYNIDFAYAVDCDIGYHLDGDFDNVVPPTPEYTGKHIYSFYASKDPLDCIGKLTAYFKNGKRCGAWYLNSFRCDQRIYFRSGKLEKIHLLWPPKVSNVLLIWGDDGWMRVVPPWDIGKYDLIDKPSVIPATPPAATAPAASQKTDEQIKALQDLITKDLQRNVP